MNGVSVLYRPQALTIALGTLGLSCMLRLMYLMAVPDVQERKNADTVAAINEQTVSETTNIAYRRYYTKDGLTDVYENFALPFLYDKNKGEVQMMIPEWNVLLFNGRNVILQKEFSGKSQQHYMLGVQDGFIAVFTDDGNSTKLMEVTTFPLVSLDQTEKQRLQSGIYIEGEENLNKALEDYGS